MVAAGGPERILMMRHWLLTVVIASSVTPIAAADPGANDAPQPVDATMVVDAALVDVCFVNRSSGWAVGERGVIWHTDDGGVTWRQQESRVTCRLNSVCFLDDRHGWAVGGASRPYSDTTQGAVLRTVDGGQTWIPCCLLLPRLARVQFAPRRRRHRHGLFLFPVRRVCHAGRRPRLAATAGRSNGPLAGGRPGRGPARAWWGAVFRHRASSVIHSPLAGSSSRRFTPWWRRRAVGWWATAG
jgi:hypothetical protein